MFNGTPKDLVSLYLIAFQILVAMYLKTLGRELTFFCGTQIISFCPWKLEIQNDAWPPGPWVFVLFVFT